MKVSWAEKRIGKVESPSGFPEIGSKVPELNRKEYRELIMGNSRVIFKIRGETLNVLTVRDFKQILPFEDAFPG